jgi:hypothetical protein
MGVWLADVSALEGDDTFQPQWGLAGRDHTRQT